MLPQYASEMNALGVSHTSVTLNAIDPALGARIYKHIRFMGNSYTGVAGASILLANQLNGIKMLVAAGIAVKVNCVVLKGVNDGHIFEITKASARLGAVMTNIMPQIPVKGSAFGDLEKIGSRELARLRKESAANIRQMTHCRQCRADAAGVLGQSCTDAAEMLGQCRAEAAGLLESVAV